jgi:hypothetical protein
LQFFSQFPRQHRRVYPGPVDGYHYRLPTEAEWIEHLPLRQVLLRS